MGDTYMHVYVCMYAYPFGNEEKRQQIQRPEGDPTRRKKHKISPLQYHEQSLSTAESSPDEGRV